MRGALSRNDVTAGGMRDDVLAFARLSRRVLQRQTPHRGSIGRSPRRRNSVFELVIGNKNYASWSLRPWFLRRTLAMPFIETRIALFQLDAGAALAAGLTLRRDQSR